MTLPRPRAPGVAALAVACAMLPKPAAADCSGWICTDVTVSRLVVDGTQIHVGTSGTETQLSCAPDASVYLTFDSTIANAQQMYALLLSAHLQKKPLWIKIQQATTNLCKIQYIVSDN